MCELDQICGVVFRNLGRVVLASCCAGHIVRPLRWIGTVTNKRRFFNITIGTPAIVFITKLSTLKRDIAQKKIALKRQTEDADRTFCANYPDNQTASLGRLLSTTVAV